MSAADTETYTDRTDRRRVGSFVGFVLSRLGPRALQLVGGTFLTLLVASRTTSALAITFAVTAYRLFLWLVYPLVGNLSDRSSTRVGRRVPYMSGALLSMAIFTWLWTVAPGYWPLVAVILGTRLAASANQMTSVVALPEVFGRSRWARAGVSVWIVGFAVSVVLRGTVVATWEDADPSTWNTTFRLAAIFMAVAGVAVLLLVREAPGAAEVRPVSDEGTLRDRLRAFVSAPDARPLIAAILALALAGGATSRLFPVYAEEVLGASTAQLALLPFAAVPLVALAVIAGASLAGRFSRRTWVVLAGVAVTAAALVGLSATELWQPVAASVVSTGVLAGATIALLPMFLRLLPERGSLGERVGLLAGPVSAAAVVGAYASGLLVDLRGDYRALWWTALIAGPLVALGAVGLRGGAAATTGGIGSLVRAAGGGDSRRRPRRRGARPGLFSGQLDQADLDASLAITAMRDFADLALTDQGPPRRTVGRLIDLLERDLRDDEHLAPTVVLTDEHGELHRGPEQVGRHLDELRRTTREPWRSVDHPEGEGALAGVNDRESILVVATRGTAGVTDLRVHRHDDGDPATWLHPVQVDLEAIRRRGRSRLRHAHIAVTLVRHFGWPVIRRAFRQPVTTVEWARRARRAFGDLGGAFVKFGQLLASSPSFVGADAADALRGLLDDAPAVPIRTVRATIRAGLRDVPVVRSDNRAADTRDRFGLDDAGPEPFRSIQPEPLGAASLAVVHRAELADGSVVAVKVLRPGIAERVAADLDLLERVAAGAERAGVSFAAGLGRAVGFLRIQMSEELDLRNERRSLEAARTRFAGAGLDLVTVPAVHPEACSASVLTMEYLEGVPLDTEARGEVDGARMSVAVDQAIKAWFLTAVRDGWFHGDVHAGNLLALSDGRVAFLDWGVTGRLSLATRDLLRDLLGASLDVPGARDRLLDQVAHQMGIDPATMGPVIRDHVGARITGLLTRPFGDSRLGALFEEGPFATDAPGGPFGSPPPRGELPGGPDRGTFLLAKQLVYFERYGAVHLTGSHLLADADFFRALLDDDVSESSLTNGVAGQVPVVAADDLEKVGRAESRTEPTSPGVRRRSWMRRTLPVLPGLVLVVAARGLWDAPEGIVVQGALVGALTALTALGLALVWRAKKVINFAQGDLGAPVAVATVLVVLGASVPVAVALPVGLVVALGSGLVVDRLIMRRFDRAPQLVVTVATIGLAQALAALAVLLPLRVDPEVLARSFPVIVSGDAIVGGVRFDGNDLMIAATVAVVLGWLGWILQRTRLGLAIRAAAELPDRASTLGVSVRGTQAAVWTIATGLSFLAVFLRVGTVGVPFGELLGPGLLLRALAAFVLAPRHRLWPIVTSAIGIGVLEASITYAADDTSWVELILAGIIAVGLLARRPRQSDRLDTERSSARSAEVQLGVAGLIRRAPRARRLVAASGIAAAAVLVGAPLLLGASSTAALTAVMCFALAAASLVVVSGWSGHLSLGQLAFAGLGAAVAAWAASNGSSDPLLVLLAGAAAGGLGAAVAGVPAFRSRGVFYSVATLAFAVAASATVLDPAWATWVPRGTVPRGELAGLVSLADERAFYWFTLAVVVLASLGLWSIGRHRTGRVLRAVRDNSATAEALGVNSRTVTLTGFAIGGVVAGLAGALLVLQQQSFGPSLFAPTESLRLLSAAVTGGLDAIGGALLGATAVYGVEWMTPSTAAWLRLASSGIGVLVVLMVIPRGIGPTIWSRFRRWVAEQVPPGHPPGGARQEPVTEPVPGAREPDRPPSVGPRPALTVTGVTVDIGNLRLLHGVDLTVGEGEIVALVGTNGAGKSTLLDAIAGTRDVTSGRIELGGVDHSASTPQQRAGAGVVHVPGGKAIFPGLSVAEHLELAAWLRGSSTPADRVHDESVVAEMIPQVTALLHRQASELSGGQQQLLAIAMALVASPSVLLIDELSLGLAPSVVAELLGVVRQLRSRGVAVVVVEQSMSTALEVADRVVFLEKGAVRFDGCPDELSRRPDLLRAVYLAEPPVSSDRPAPAGPAEVVLRAEHLTRRFAGVTAVDDLSIEVRRGEIVGLIGPNGAGKTTALDLLSGLHHPTSGTVWLGERRIDRLPPVRRSRLGVVRSFQDARLFPSLTSLEVVAVSLEHDARWADPVLEAVRFPNTVDADRDIRERARELLRANGLAEYADVPIRALSTGVRRLVDLTCIAGLHPSVILLDEPAAGIAGAELEGMAARLLAMRDASGAAVVVVEHDLAFVAAVADRLVAMVGGRVVADGPPDQVLRSPEVESSYLGTTTGGVR